MPREIYSSRLGFPGWTVLILESREKADTGSCGVGTVWGEFLSTLAALVAALFSSTVYWGFISELRTLRH